jgi:two-component system cell cycle sensor histidine kinase/response regulator CckA
MLAGEVLEHEITNVQKDGSPRFYELREAAITLPNGSKAILAVSNDVTERKRAEQAKLEMERQLLHMQKLESLGVLAGGIAHDFNNLLAAMLGNVELAMMDLPATSPAQKSLKIALAAGWRATRLTRQMLDYSGRGRFVITDVDLSQLVRGLAELLKVSVSKSARLELCLAQDLPVIWADASQLQQVVMNLITNASEAIGEQQGTMTITTDVRECDAAYLAGSRLAIKPPPGRYVSLEVCDTGCGMDESVQEKLFDPFFTTKFVGRGLGMSGVLGVVQGHHGAIMVSSQPGKGTVIRVLFPASPAPASTDTQMMKAPPIHSIPAMPVLSGMVLVAEDEAQLRIFIESLLKRMGLRVISAADGEQAVALFQQHASEITFVLLDLTMPKLDGLKTLAEIRRLRPGVKAVLTSGYDGGDITSRYSKEGFDAFIQKPYELEVLTKLVHQMCASVP